MTSRTALHIALTEPSEVRGNVIDMATRRNIPADVIITVENEKSLVSDAALSDDGNFAFEDLPDGPALIEARSEGYAPRISTMTVREKEGSSITIGLLLEARVTGTVVNSSGEPVLGAAILVWYEDLEGGEMLESLIGGRLFSGEEGDFEVDSLVPDTRVNLQADFDGRSSQVVTVTVGPGSVQEGVTLSL